MLKQFRATYLMKFMSRVVLVLALAAVPVHAQIIERVLVKVNGDIFTQTELEERQTAAIRARMGVDYKPDMVNNNAELKKALDEVTPQLLVDAIDELLLLQMGKEKGYHLSDEQFQAWLHNPRKEQNPGDRHPAQGTEPRRRAEVSGSAEAGRDDDRRSAQERRAAVSRWPGTARRS